MKKSKKILSMFLAMLMAFTSLTAGFYAFAAEEESASAVDSLAEEIKAFYDNRYGSYLFSETNANYKAANEAFDSICTNLKSLSAEEKLVLPTGSYAFVLYYLTEQVGRNEAGLSSANGKVYGMTKGIDSVIAKAGEFPKDYQDALDIMGAIYTKVNDKLFNSSFNFKTTEGGYEHFEKYVPEISKLTAKGVEFASYFYPNGDAFYVYCANPANAGSYLISNLATITKNYYQDKNTSSGSDPSSVSMTTFTSGSGANRKWRSGQSAATYKAAMEAYNEQFMANTCVAGEWGYKYLADVFSGIFGDEFKYAAELAFETGMKYFKTGDVSVQEINEVTAAVNAVSNETAKTILNGIMSNSNLYAACSLEYPLGSAEDYDENIDAVTVYSNQIKHNKKTVSVLVNDLQDVINNMYLNEFNAYMAELDMNDFSVEDAVTAIEKYNKMSDAFKKKVDAETYQLLIDVATRHFIAYVNSVDLDSKTEENQTTAYSLYQAMGQFKSEIPAEVYEKYVLIQSPIMDMNDFSNDIAAFQTTGFIRPNNSKVAWTVGGIQSAADATWDLVAESLIPMISKDIDLSNGLDATLEDNLYQAQIISEIFGLYATLSHDQSDIDVGMGGLTFKLGTIIGWIVSDTILINMLSANGDQFSGAIEKIKAVELTAEDTENGLNKLDKIAAIKFTAEDFGFKAGDRDGFADALLAVLRPITTLLAPDAKIKAMGIINVDVNIKMFDYMSDGAYVEGVYANLLPVLEQIGMSALPTEEEYEANYYSVKEASGTYIAADEFLRPVIEHLFTDVIDVISPDPLNGLIKVLPRLAYVIGTDMLNNTLGNVFKQLGVLSGLGGSLDLSADAVNNMIAGAPIDLSGVVGKDCKLQLKAIDWLKLADCATVSAVPSSTNSNAYTLLRTGETESCFSNVFYYLYDVIYADKNNYAAIQDLISTALSGTVSDIILNFVNWLGYGGNVSAYGKYLDYVGTVGTEPIEKPNYTKPEMVTGLKTAARGGAGERLKISWNAQKDADGYNVYKKTNGKWFLEATVTGTSYIFGDLVPGWEYDFRVSAYKGDTSNTGAAAELHTCAACPTMEAPEVAPAGSNALRISWDVVNSHGYLIQYSTDAQFKTDVNSVYVTGHNADNYTIKTKAAASSYYVRVRAWRNFEGGLVYGAWSSSSQLNPDGIYQVTGLYTAARGGMGEKLRIAWDAQKNAESYNVYAKSGDEWILAGNTEASEFVFDDLVPGWEYFYKVAAVQNGQEGKLSAELHTCAACPPMDAPVITAAGKNEIKVEWNVVNSHGYVVQYSTDSEFKSNVNSVYVTGHDADSYTITAANAENCFVRVRAWRNFEGGMVYGVWSAPAEL